MTADPTATSALVPLAIDINDVRRVFAVDVGRVVVGRDATAAVFLDDPRISRAHLELLVSDGHWVATDLGSRNGTYLDGQRVTTVAISGPTTLRLGDPDGVVLLLSLDDGSDATHQIDAGRDLGMVRAGQYAAAQRAKLGISQRDVAAMKILSQGALVSFEKGRSWPRDDTLANLEDLLQCPRGTLAQIRYGTDTSTRSNPLLQAALPQDTATALAVRAVQSAVRVLSAASTTLPEPSAPQFSPVANALLAELRELQAVSTDMSRAGAGASVVTALGQLRRLYAEVMHKAARSPQATLGQRLFAARTGADLSVEDLAAITAVPVAAINAAEKDHFVDPAHVPTLTQFIDSTLAV